MVDGRYEQHGLYVKDGLFIKDERDGRYGQTKLPIRRFAAFRFPSYALRGNSFVMLLVRCPCPSYHWFPGEIVGWVGLCPDVSRFAYACLRRMLSIFPGIQPTISRVASVSFVRRSDELARKMVGWTPCKIVGPSVSREVGLATTSGNRPTHPTLPTQPRADCREGEQILAEKNLPKLDDFHRPSSHNPAWERVQRAKNEWTRLSAYLQTSSLHIFLISAFLILSQSAQFFCFMANW